MGNPYRQTVIGGFSNCGTQYGRIIKACHTLEGSTWKAVVLPHWQVSACATPVDVIITEGSLSNYLSTNECFILYAGVLQNMPPMMSAWQNHTSVFCDWTVIIIVGELESTSTIVLLSSVEPQSGGLGRWSSRKDTPEPINAIGPNPSAVVHERRVFVFVSNTRNIYI